MGGPGRAALLALALILAIALGFVLGERVGHDRAKRPLLAAPEAVCAPPSPPIAAAPAAPCAPSTSSAAPARYTLVVSTHADLKAAGERAARLRAAGHDVHAWPRSEAGGYAIRLGAFSSVKDAQAFRAMVRERSALETTIVSLP